VGVAGNVQKIDLRVNPKRFEICFARMAASRVRIRDVAKAAGTAPSTVSNALNGTGHVDPATRERITKVAAELGYVPNRTARGLRTGRAGVLGIMLSARPEAGEVANVSYNLRLAGSASRAAFRRRNALMLLPPLTTVEDAARLTLDGVILTDIEDHDEAKQAFMALGIPIVTIEADPSDPDDDFWVGADTITNTRTGLDHLTAVGANRIAFIGPDATGTWYADSLRAYRDWCTERDQAPVQSLIDQAETFPEIEAAVRELLSGPEPPDAIFALTEKIAVSVGQILGAMGVAIPGQIRLLSGSDGDRAAQAAIPISAIDLHAEEVGAAAVALLYERIEGLDTERPRIVRATLNARASTTGRDAV
jgi:DNA-binding LacI/PurR family transcriptional regulator